MNSLKRALQLNIERRNKTGGAASSLLIRQLRELRKRHFISFLVLEALVIMGLAIGIYLLVNQPASGLQLAALGGVLGLGTGGSIEMMRRIWKEWGQVELLLMLVEEASESQVTDMVDRLIKTLQ